MNTLSFSSIFQLTYQRFFRYIFWFLLIGIGFTLISLSFGEWARGIFSLLSSLALGIPIFMIRDIEMSGKARFWHSIKEMFCQLHRIFIVQMIWAFTVGLASLALLIPGVILAICLYVYLPNVLIEKRSIGEGWSRSFDLTRGKRWRIFWIQLGMTLIMNLVVGVFYALGLLLIISFYGPLTVALKMGMIMISLGTFWALGPILSTNIYYALLRSYDESK